MSCSAALAKPCCRSCQSINAVKLGSLIIGWFDVSSLVPAAAYYLSMITLTAANTPQDYSHPVIVLGIVLFVAITGILIAAPSILIYGWSTNNPRCFIPFLVCGIVKGIAFGIASVVLFVVVPTVSIAPLLLLAFEVVKTRVVHLHYRDCVQLRRKQISSLAVENLASEYRTL